ncbi:AAA family ATPase [Corallococcus coralloides]|nr:AAA family ATPase [Corallococcus coralloides]
MPAETRLQGVVLFVDVAGFTQLTERLSLRGLEGAELLSEVLNSYFGRMTDLITGHGGEVLFFAGDAALALWSAPAPSALPRLIALATQCARRVCQELYRFSPVPDVALMQRAAIGAGPLAFLELGGVEGRGLPLVAGPAITQLGLASRLGGPGQVVLSAESWALAGGQVDAVALEGGCGRVESVRQGDAGPGTPPLPTLDAALLGPYVPEVVLQRLRAGHGQWLAEFRPVSAVFIHLPEQDYLSPEALPRMQEVVTCCQHLLRRYQGHIYQLVMDDKGTCLIAAFGLPPSGQENEAAHAVEAAEALHHELTARGLQTSMGIATGRMFCGPFGSASRRQYTLLGNAMNLAARLMQDARGGILCDAATAEQARSRLEFEPLAPRQVKGRSEPVPVFRPRASAKRQRQAGRGVLVGREAQRQRLETQVRELLRGQGGVLVMQGEAGIGKSTLLEELARQAEAQGARVLRGAADAVERSTPYYAWRELLWQLVDGVPEEEGPALGARLLQGLAGDTRLLEWAPLLNLVLPVGLPENDITRSMAGEARAEGLQALLLALYERWARGTPAVLLLDDAHWLDSSSAALAASVARRASGLLLVVAARPLDDAEPSGAQLLVEWPGAVRLPLEKLSTDEISALLRRRLGVLGVAGEIVHFIVERAEGHPFYSEELALALKEEGLIERRGDTCQVAPGAGALSRIPFPDNVQAVVASRIDRLALHEQLALKTASVIGRVFSRDLLSSVYPVAEDRPRLPEGLHHLARVDLTRLERPEPELAYRFKHAITQEVSYNALLFRQRRQLHGEVARWYEQRGGEEPSEFYALLAHHYDRAEEVPKAIEYLERAGEAALRGFSSREAERFLRRASELAAKFPQHDDPHRRSVRELNLGHARHQQADYPQACEHYFRSLELRGWRAPRTRGGMVWSVLGHLFRQVAHRGWPSRFLDGARGARRADLLHAGAIYGELTKVAWYRGDVLALLHGTFTQLNLGEQTGSAPEIMPGAAGLAVALGLAGWHGLARSYLERALTLAGQGRHPASDALTYTQAAVYAIGAGFWDEARAHARKAGELLARLGDRNVWEGVRALEGYVHLSRGELDSALTCFDEAYASARSGTAQARIWARNGHLAALLPRGEVPEAMVAELKALVGVQSGTAESMAGHGLLAQAYLRRGALYEARASADTALRLLKEQQPMSSYVPFWGLVAMTHVYLELCEREGAGPQARELRLRAREACGLLRSFSRMFTLARAQAALCDGWYLALVGKARRAGRRLRDGIDVARRLQSPCDEALLHLELARRLEPAHPQRAQGLATAEQLFERCGARHGLLLARALGSHEVRLPAVPVSLPSSGVPHDEEADRDSGRRHRSPHHGP